MVRQRRYDLFVQSRIEELPYCFLWKQDQRQGFGDIDRKITPRRYQNVLIRHEDNQCIYPTTEGKIWALIKGKEPFQVIWWSKKVLVTLQIPQKHLLMQKDLAHGEEPNHVGRKRVRTGIKLWKKVEFNYSGCLLFNQFQRTHDQLNTCAMQDHDYRECQRSFWCISACIRHLCFNWSDIFCFIYSWIFLILFLILFRSFKRSSFL